jgi:hypothetical protein
MKVYIVRSKRHEFVRGVGTSLDEVRKILNEYGVGYIKDFLNEDKIPIYDEVICSGSGKPSYTRVDVVGYVEVFEVAAE